MMIRPWVCRCLAALLLVVAFAVTAQAQMSFEDGMTAYDRGDFTTALKIWRPLAEQGGIPAQYNLGLMYHKGRGVVQDYSEAANWYRKAAKQDYADAQNNLGAMYSNGQGVVQDYAEAVKWYRKAAEQGNALAQGNLGAMYGLGRGVPQDYVQAHKWLNLAAALLRPSEDRGKAVKASEFVEGKMTPAQVAEAQRLAREWKPK